MWFRCTFSIRPNVTDHPAAPRAPIIDTSRSNGMNCSRIASCCAIAAQADSASSRERTRYCPLPSYPKLAVLRIAWRAKPIDGGGEVRAGPNVGKWRHRKPVSGEKGLLAQRGAA